MKSSLFKLLFITGAVVVPLLVWSVLNQPQDIRSRAQSSTDPTATPTVTPTLSATPSATPTSTPTATLTPTPTNNPPLCLGLSANPGAGAKPLTVKFACAGYDGNNDITAAEFGFGAGQKQLVEKNVGQYGSLTTSYTYETEGTYEVTCRVRDSNNAFSDYPSYCKYSVIVNGNALTPTPFRTPAPTRPVPTSPLVPDAAPIVYTGNAPTARPLPTSTPAPSLAMPSPTGAQPSLLSNPKFRQILIMLIVSAVTIAAALGLHSYFEKR